MAERIRAQREARFRVQKDDRAFSHDDFLKAADEWKANQRITGGKYEWVEDRHVLAAARTTDIPLLIDVAAACCARLSDEALSELQILNGVVKRIGRSRYRADAGVCERVQPVRVGQ